MKFQVLTAVKISTVTFLYCEPCTFGDGYQRPKHPRHKSDMQSSASHGSVSLPSTWDAMEKKRLLFACHHSTNAPYSFLPSEVNKTGPYDAAVALSSASLHLYH